ncbi:MAG: hypothetical protein ACRC92_27425 [Peptostreptococcaceae bacterium]
MFNRKINELGVKERLLSVTDELLGMRSGDDLLQGVKVLNRELEFSRNETIRRLGETYGDDLDYVIKLAMMIGKFSERQRLNALEEMVK